MLTREGARLQVHLELVRRHGLRSGPEELVILDERTLERDWGWVFFHTIRGWRDGDLRYAVGGNAPILVNRHDGTLRDTGTALPVESYIDLYEAEIERQQQTWELVIQERSDGDLHVARRLKQVLGLSFAELGSLRKRLPCVWQAGARMDLEPIFQRLVEAEVPAELRRASP